MITSVIMDILALLSGFPKDSGPVYRETIEGRLPVEPFNTASNFLFLAIIIYFVWKIRRNHRQHLFLAFILPVLFIGFIGGTLYHATRSHEIWLLLDWVPILPMSGHFRLLLYQGRKKSLVKVSIADFSIITDVRYTLYGPAAKYFHFCGIYCCCPRHYFTDSPVPVFHKIPVRTMGAPGRYQLFPGHMVQVPGRPFGLLSHGHTLVMA